MTAPVPLTDAADLADALATHWAWDQPDEPTAEWAVGIVSALIRGYCPGLQLTPVTAVTATFQGTPSHRLLTGVRPLVAVTAVKVDGVTVEPGAYSTRRSGVLVRRDGLGWGGADAEVTVTYDAGFDTGAIPEDLAAVCQLAAVRLAGNPGAWRSQPDGIPGEPGTLVAAFPGAFTVWELAVLNRYRRRTA